MLRSTSTRVGRTARTLLVLILLTLALVPAAALAAPLAVPTIDIADARALPLGSTVTVKGSVTVPSGVFSSSAFDQGFVIQNKTGGIYVRTATNLGLAPQCHQWLSTDGADQALGHRQAGISRWDEVGYV